MVSLQRVEVDARRVPRIVCIADTRGKLRDLQRLAVRQRDCGADPVFELAHVPRPSVGEHACFAPSLSTRRLAAVEKLFRKYSASSSDVIAAIAQGRKIELERAQPKQQITAELPGVGQISQACVAGCDDPHVVATSPRYRAGERCVARSRAAAAPEGQWHRADFVQEQRAAVGVAEHARDDCAPRR